MEHPHNKNNVSATCEVTFFTATSLTVKFTVHIFCLYPILPSSVGIATDYGLDGPGIESRWGRDFPPVQTGPGAHPASCTMGTGSFPGVKCGRGMLLTTHPLLAPRSWKGRAIPLPPLWATTGPVTGLLYFLPNTPTCHQLPTTWYRIFLGQQINCECLCYGTQRPIM